jgi:hypothetical protein
MATKGHDSGGGSSGSNGGSGSDKLLLLILLMTSCWHGNVAILSRLLQILF